MNSRLGTLTSRGGRWQSAGAAFFQPSVGKPRCRHRSRMEWLVCWGRSSFEQRPLRGHRRPGPSGFREASPERSGDDPDAAVTIPERPGRSGGGIDVQLVLACGRSDGDGVPDPPGQPGLAPGTGPGIRLRHGPRCRACASPAERPPRTHRQSRPLRRPSTHSSQPGRARTGRPRFPIRMVVVAHQAVAMQPYPEASLHLRNVLQEPARVILAEEDVLSSDAAARDVVIGPGILYS